MPKILLVDDTDAVRAFLRRILEQNGFEAVEAANVNDALKLIGSQIFDVLVSDLHTPNSGDGLALLSAMRRSNPKAVTLIFSGYPDMKQPAAAILLDADEVLVNPLAPDTLVAKIRERLERGTTPARTVENVSNINKQEAPSTVQPSNFAEVAKQAKAKRAKLDATSTAREAKRVKDQIEEKRKRNAGGLLKPRPPS